MAKRFTAKDITVQEMTKDGLHNRNLATGETERISRRIHREYDLERHASPDSLYGQKRTLKLSCPGGRRRQSNDSDASSKRRSAKEDGYNRDTWHTDSKKSKDKDKSDKRLQVADKKRYTLDFHKSDISVNRRQFYKDSFKSNDTQGFSPEKKAEKLNRARWNNPKESMRLDKLLARHVAYKKAKGESEDNSGVKAALESARYSRYAMKTAYSASVKTRQFALRVKGFVHERYALSAERAAKQASKKIKQKAAQRAASRAASTAVNTGQKLIKLAITAAKSIVHAIAMAVGTIGLPAAIVIAVAVFFLILLQSCAVPYLNGFLAAYPADPGEVHNSASYMTELELALQNEIDGIESDPGWDYIDEFDFSPGKQTMISSITHNPIELMAYLSAVYKNFQFVDVRDVIQRIFNEMYRLDYDVETYEELVGYDEDDDPIYETRYILHVTLTTKTFLDVVKSEIEADATIKRDFDIYMEMVGSGQAVTNPFTIDWRPYVSCHYGYRLNPMDGVSSQFHPGMDIALGMGTPIRAGVTGTVTSVQYGHSIYGNNITIQDFTGQYIVHYSHCSEVYSNVGDFVFAGQDILAAIGSTGASTGPHLDIEIKRNGEYVNPIFVLDYSPA